MYEVGSLILYGRTGVCEVVEIKPSTLPSHEGQLFYTLRPLYQNCNITTPVNNLKVFSRPIISKEEAERIIDMIPGITAVAYHNRNLTQLKEHYKEQIECHDCMGLVEMTMSLYAKRKEAEMQKRKFGAVDERFMKEAEELLFGELACALGIEKGEVLSYIGKRIGESEKRK